MMHIFIPVSFKSVSTLWYILVYSCLAEKTFSYNESFAIGANQACSIFMYLLKITVVFARLSIVKLEVMEPQGCYKCSRKSLYSLYFNLHPNPNYESRLEGTMTLNVTKVAISNALQPIYYGVLPAELRTLKRLKADELFKYYQRVALYQHSERSANGIRTFACPICRSAKVNCGKTADWICLGQ